ncbi:MAG: tRNA pseudouridine(55) synthase TruB [Granulosicoccus sp.]
MARRHRRGRPVHGILLLDKPAGGSSNHALQRAKRLFGAAKAGHTGSLDPLATGMLPICFGEATKLAGFLIDADKGYETTLKLGVTTNSADADGQVLETREVPPTLDQSQFEEICQRFIGPIMQVPPMVSAIKIDGKRLYKLAREGKEVERPARPVVIHELEVLAFSGDSARLAVRCSKGTYIRSLITDIGEAIGCGAHVSALRRTFVSPFGQYPMISLETLERMMAAVSDDAGDAVVDTAALWPALDALLLPPDAGLEHLARVTLDEAGNTAFLHGNSASCIVDQQPEKRADRQSEPLCRVYDIDGKLMGLGELGDSGTVSPRRVLQWG